MVMKISEFIKQLEYHKELFGDMYVVMEIPLFSPTKGAYYDRYLDITMDIRHTESDKKYIGLKGSQYYLCLS